MKQSRYKYVGPDDMHNRFLREMADAVTKPSPSNLKSHVRQVKSLVIGKRETLLTWTQGTKTG